MSDWIDRPEPPVIYSRAPPVLVTSGHLDQFVAFVRNAGADSANVEVADATSSFDVVEALKVKLPFPDWCGSSWDSIEDAFEELRSAWTFPLVLVLRGYGQLLDQRRHVALQTAIRFDDLERAFSAAGDQLVVAFEAASWT